MQSASATNNYHYNKNLKQYASELRNNATKAESCLWKYILRSGKLKNHKFRRQRPVLNYIADFMCLELMLIIEVDGFSHLIEEVIKKDQQRQKDLENIGFTVLRFTDNEVLKDLANVERVLEGFVEEHNHKTK
jgi:very-short-patch-repair endonuclease